MEEKIHPIEKSFYEVLNKDIVDLSLKVDTLINRINKLELKKTDQECKKEVQDIIDDPHYGTNVDLANILVSGTSRLTHRWKNAPQLQYPETDAITSDYLARYLTQAFEVLDHDDLTISRLLRIMLDRGKNIWVIIPKTT